MSANQHSTEAGLLKTAVKPEASCSPRLPGYFSQSFFFLIQFKFLLPAIEGVLKYTFIHIFSNAFNY